MTQTYCHAFPLKRLVTLQHTIAASCGLMKPLCVVRAGDERYGNNRYCRRCGRGTLYSTLYSQDARLGWGSYLLDLRRRLKNQNKRLSKGKVGMKN